MPMSDIAVRTIVDLPESQVRRLAEHARRRGISRAEAIRRAVADLLAREGAEVEDEAFGLWRDHGEDGLAYEQRLRVEWIA
jgi:hypothetical protein